MASGVIALRDAANRSAVRLGYPAGLKKEQLEVVVAFMQGRDVFAVLPTGFGKSMCYACLPFAFADMEGSEEAEKPIVVVATPLTAIMKDQMVTFNKKGLKVACVTGGVDDTTMKKGVQAGKFELVFFTPELLINSKRWRRVLSSPTYTHRLRGFVVDEAHCVAKWGDTFRSSLRRLGEVRSILPIGVRVMAVTATATKTLRYSVSKTLGLHKPYVMALCPCKENLVYATGKCSNVSDTFDPLVERLAELRSQLPRMIIYCRRFQECSDIYILFKNLLGSCFTDPAGAPDITKFRMVEMFTSVTDDDIKGEIIKLFTSESQLRIVVATIAFGMGIDCGDVREVIHVGAPDDMESYIQETGRAGRDGLPALAILLETPCKRHLKDESMIEYIDNKNECRREKLFGNMEAYERLEMSSKCLCCDLCAKDCDCDFCEVNCSQFMYF